MHFHTLGVVSIPPVTDEPEVTARIESCIVELERECANDPDTISVVRAVITGKLRSQLNAFSREVFSAVEELMAPYGVDSEDYYEFIDKTQQIQEGYESEKTDCVRMPDGRVLRLTDIRLHRRFVILNGQVFERNAGRLRQPKRTHIARKMKALPDYPMTKLFPSLEEYARRIRGYEYDEDHHGYGDYRNPNAIYDYYTIGGGWPTTFLIRDSCSDGCIGERCWGEEDTIYPVPDGYIWVSAARKKDIEWEVMKDWRLQTIRDRYSELVEMFVTGSVEPQDGLLRKDDCVYVFGRMIYRIGESEEEFYNRFKSRDTRRFPVSFSGLVSETGWIPGDDACLIPDVSGVTQADWVTTVQQFIEDLPDDAVLVSIDHHM